jgi:hypothetical protein
LTDRPADCELDWGDSSWIGPGDRRGELFCRGDTVMNPDAAELGYGGSIARSGICCESDQTGLTCTNGAGHGFFLSKARQRIF